MTRTDKVKPALQAGKQAKSARSKPRRPRSRSADNAPAKTPARIVNIPFVEGGSLDQTLRMLETTFPEWEKLDKVQRRELAALIMENRTAQQPVRVELSRSESGSVSIAPAGDSDALTVLKLYKAFAANSLEAVNARGGELVKYLESVGACNDGRYNAALSFMESMEPRDQSEAMLLVRHYVTHDASIRALAMMGSADFVPQMQTFGNLAAKLMARADQQLETLAKLRRGGEQVVKHIHIDNRHGGQAIVSDTFIKGGSGVESRDQSHALSAAMWRENENGLPLHGARDQGPEAVSHAQRAGEGGGGE